MAALGATLEVPTLDGPAEVEVGEGTQPGEVLTLRGRGMPGLRNRARPPRRGDLQVVVNVVIPRHLSGDQKDLLRRLADSLDERNLREDGSLGSKLRRLLGGRGRG